MENQHPVARAVNTHGAALYLGLAPKTLANWRSPSCPVDGPPWRSLGRRVVYEISDLDAFLDAQPKGWGGEKENHDAA